MEIIDNGLLEESIEAILAEKFIFNSVDEDLKVLIVEGDDDIQVISKYYFFKKDSKMPFRVCVGEDLDENNSGKRSAIASFNKYKEMVPNIMCLLDRDLDFLLDRKENDERIIYYDFYELENYLFEDRLLKIFINRFYDFDNAEYEMILSYLLNISEYYKPLCKLLLIRDTFKAHEFEDGNDKLNKIAELAKKDLTKIVMNNSQHYLGMDLQQKITYYLNEELTKVNLDYDFIEEQCCFDDVAATTDGNDDELMIFKYFIGSKTVLKSIQCLMQNTISLDFNKVGSQISLEQSLKKEWIPNNSYKFASLMTYIEETI